MDCNAVYFSNGVPLWRTLVKLEAARFSISYCSTTQCHNTEDLNFE